MILRPTFELLILREHVGLVHFILVIILLQSGDDEVASSYVDQTFIIIIEEVVPSVERLTTNDAHQLQLHFRLPSIINILSLIGYALPQRKQFIV